MGKNEKRFFVCDFETTVYRGQKDTRVWASAMVELFSENVEVYHTIEEQINAWIALDQDIVVFFHNLKFDGSFILDWLFQHDYRRALDGQKWIETKYMKNNTFSCSISAMGQFYTLNIKVNNHLIEIRDSLKLLPFSVKTLGKSFGTKHRKLDMEYAGRRYPGCNITEKEKEYIKNDVLVVKEALEIMAMDNHLKLTIGACCLSEYKKIMGKDYDSLFPSMYDVPIPENIYGENSAGEYIRHSYRGGWCYCPFENHKAGAGITADVNSLYPSMMHSESGNRYPVGQPTFWKGDYIPDEAQDGEHFYFIRVRTKFKLKDGFLPFLQIKGSPIYDGTKCLTTSDYWDKKTQAYYDEYIDRCGERRSTRCTLTWTCVDYNLIKKHYDLYDFEILDGCYFNTEIGIFDEYINKYATIKKTSKGAKRTEAKLFLNNLYGKMAMSTDSSYKVPFMENNVVRFYQVVENEKIPGYIPVGSAITAYARRFTITAAQENYYGPDKPGFRYADTDSIHCEGITDKTIKGIKVHPTNFCCWALESSWDHALFVRQKTYIEHVIAENLETVEPYYNMKCAGMPGRCKDLFIANIEGVTMEPETPEQKERLEKLDVKTKREKDFLSERRTIEDFKVGLVVPSKLLPRRIPGGTLLSDTNFELRPHK